VFGLSSFHLLRVFRRETGLTPHQYALQLRLRRTLLELEDSPPRLAELATGAGFSSHAHFSSAFRAAWGLTPQQYAGNRRA
jgi:AraC-like DNA-binding protein